MVSYQCSQLSTPEGIIASFRQCAKLQEGRDLDTLVSAVVLDEVGLAEDSPRMPLKVCSHYTVYIYLLPYLQGLDNSI